MELTIVAVCAGAYLLGSIPFGLLVARLKKVDITKTGSGNIGATNVARALGKPLGILVLVLDALKGFTPVFIAERVLTLPAAAVAAAGLLAILGHVFPVWLRFRGGKGVATGLGVFLALSPFAAGCAVGAYALLYAIFRISSLGSLGGGTTLLVIMLVTHRPLPYAVLTAVAWALIVWRHRGNIARLVRRQEKRL